MSSWSIIFLISCLSAITSNAGRLNAKECVLSAHKYRFSWCDVLRGVIEYDEWVQEATKVTAADISVTSMFFGTTWNSRDELLDEENGIIATMLSGLNEPYIVCINNFGSNYRELDNENKKEVIVEIPNNKIYRVNSTFGPPGTPSSINDIIEYDVDLYQCVKENGDIKINFYDETQGFTVFDN